jgi:hypothetical protein
MQAEIVKAHKIDNFHIYYVCNHCWTKYKKDGTPYKNAKKVIHRHGSCNQFDNRIESRVPHCINRNPMYSGIEIIIDNSTKKIDDPILRKRFEKQYKYLYI